MGIDGKLHVRIERRLEQTLHKMKIQNLEEGRHGIQRIDGGKGKKSLHVDVNALFFLGPL
jgi:hypothetical protein